MEKHLEELDILGYTLIENIITPEEVKEIKESKELNKNPKTPQ